MKTTHLILRRNRVQRLMLQSLQDKKHHKSAQAQFLLNQIDLRLVGLTAPTNHYKNLTIPS